MLDPLLVRCFMFLILAAISLVMERFYYSEYAGILPEVVTKIGRIGSKILLWVNITGATLCLLLIYAS